MRPTKHESDLEYYATGRDYWTRRLEEYFLMTASPDPETSAWATAQEKRVQARLFATELLHAEARGEIVVYTGRPAPAWAVA